MGMLYTVVLPWAMNNIMGIRPISRQATYTLYSVESLHYTMYVRIALECLLNTPHPK